MRSTCVLIKATKPEQLKLTQAKDQSDLLQLNRAVKGSGPGRLQNPLPDHLCPDPVIQWTATGEEILITLDDNINFALAVFEEAMENENILLQYVNNLPVKAGKILEKIHLLLNLEQSLNFYLYCRGGCFNFVVRNLGKFPSSDL